jgi:hypothetical protein
VRGCGTANLTELEVDLIELFANFERLRLGRRPAAIATIPVAFHVVYIDQGFGFTFGLLSQADVQNQIDALNAAFAPSGISFTLAQTSFTNNQEWFLHAPGTVAERNMKLALGADSSKFLNIYSTGATFTGLLGYATFPWNRRRAPELDGVVISYDSIPGGTFPYDEGDTAVHEVGHWCGLYHTFQGGCSRRNDVVADTPAEAQPFFGCSFLQPDTCPAPGLDPIFNYMDYSDDACLTEFTPGQTARMMQMLSTFRPGFVQ